MFNRNVLVMLIIVLLAISCCPLCKATGNEDLKISGAANAPGVGYTRWGRTTCSSGAEVVYKGYIAGGRYNEGGSGGNYLCIQENPQAGPGNVAGIQTYSGRLYGIEFMMPSPYGHKQPFSNENLGQQSLSSQDAVCALCYRPNRSYSVMMPGRQDCGAGNSDWVLEYKGYLMSAYYDYQRTEFICVDEAPEARPGGAATSNGASFAPVQAFCGSLPCPPFVSGDEVTCAVCSR